MPSFVLEGPWWGLFLFLTGVVFVRTQGTYWVGRWARGGADAVAERTQKPASRRARLAHRLSGPGMDRARVFLERRGYLGIPVSFLTVGFQTMVNVTAGFARMRFDLYTLAMFPGCLMWATMYTAIGLSLWEVWLRSPWLLVAALGVVITAAFALNRWRRRATDGAAAHAPARADMPAG
ncbi:MAG: DedA family protein [Demequina sp.]